MSKINCLIVDDEPHGREVLEHFARQVSFIEVVDVCEDPITALEILKTHPVNLLLSDIQMPKINGLEFVRSLPVPPVIIFVTAHVEYAFNSFDLGVADYLLKPVSFERFLKAINKAQLLIGNQRQISPTGTNEYPDYFFVKANNKLNKVIFNEVLYIESVGNYIKIFTSGATLTSYSTMLSIESKLPSDRFIRIHNSYIISIKAVKAIDGLTVELFNNVSLPVSKGRKDALYAAMQIKES